MCPRKFTLFVHENLTSMSTRNLLPSTGNKGRFEPWTFSCHACLQSCTMDSYMINKDISSHIHSRSKLVQTLIRHSHPIWPLYPSQLFSLLWNQPAFLYLSFYKTSPSRGRIRSDLEKKRFSCSAASQTH